MNNFILIALLLALNISPCMAAGELNARTHLDTATQAKVNNLLANTYTQGDTAQKTVTETTATTGKQAGQQVNIGSSQNAKNALREQTTVVNGDVTVVCHRC
jgi:hypothetical protein